MIYRHDRIEISNLIGLTIPQLYDPKFDIRRHRTTCIDFESTIFQLHQRPIFLQNRNTHSKIRNFKVRTYQKFRPNSPESGKTSPAAALSRPISVLWPKRDRRPPPKGSPWPGEQNPAGPPPWNRRSRRRWLFFRLPELSGAPPP